MNFKKNIFFQIQKKVFLSALFVFAVIFLILKVDVKSESVEKNIYDYYAESIVRDLDFNVINQVPEKERWQITPTGNYPDVHSNGVSVLWSPFFYLKKIISVTNESYSANHEKVLLARSLSTLFYGILFLVFIYQWLRRKFEHLDVLPIFAMFYFATSHYYFLTISPGNADISSGFIGILEIIAFEKIYKKRSFLDCFLFGTLIGYGIALKVDHVFFLLLPLSILLSEIKKSETFKKLLKESLLFLMGFAVPIFSLIINDYIKYGRLGYGYYDVLNFKYYQIFENLFWPPGFLNNTPIYIVSFIGMVLIAFNKNILENIFIFIPLCSLLVESFAFIHQESYGGRHWIAYFPSLAYCFFYTYEQIKNKRSLQMIFYLFVMVSIARNLYIGFFSYHFGDALFLGKANFSDFINSKMSIFNLYLFEFHLIHEKLQVMFPLTIFLVVIVLLVRFFKVKPNPFVLGGIFAFVYLLMTVSNVVNNRKNFELMKNEINYSIVGNGPRINSLFENLGTIEKSILFYTVNYNKEKLEYLKQLRSDYVKTSAGEILEDKVGFKEKLEMSKDNFIPKEWRSD